MRRYDEVLSGGNIVVVDVRRESETSRGDIEFPRRAANKVLSVPREKLSGNFNNMGDVEANLTALKVAGLKVWLGFSLLMLIDPFDAASLTSPRQDAHLNT